MDKDKPDFVESVISQALSGHFEGEYVAACASEPGCGYMGEVAVALPIGHKLGWGDLMYCS